MVWATFWAIFSQTSLVNLLATEARTWHDKSKYTRTISLATILLTKQTIFLCGWLL
jgi:hypothetical protein